MNWHRVRLIFHREVRDQIRDRRTLFMVVVLPLLLYPGLAIGMVQVTLLFREQPRTVVILGAAELPPKPSLLDPENDRRVCRRLVHDPCRCGQTANCFGREQSAEGRCRRGKTRQRAFDRARELRPLAEQYDRLQQAAKNASSAEEAARADEQVRVAKDELAEKFSNTKIQVLIIVPRA